MLLQGQPWNWTKLDVLHWHISPTALNSPEDDPRNTCTRGNGRHRRAAPAVLPVISPLKLAVAGGSSSYCWILHIHLQIQARALKAMGKAHSRFCLLCPGALWFVAASVTHGISCCTKRGNLAMTQTDFMQRKNVIFFRLLHTDEGKYVIKLSILPTSLCFLFLIH